MHDSFVVAKTSFAAAAMGSCVRGRRRWIAVGLMVVIGGMLFVSPSGGQARADEVVRLEFAAGQTAVLDPAQWERPFPNQNYFDALRPLLVRFPGFAETVHERLRQGYRIDKLELLLDWQRQEGARPERGRSGWGAEAAYEQHPGQWHVLARGLLKPWDAGDPDTAPTADAYVNGRGFWRQAAARADGADRLATVFGPAPLHADSPVAALEVTALLAEPAWGRSLGERLRAVEERGFQVLKQELFDPRYNDQEGGWFDVYSWRAGVGYMRIWVAPPRLVATLRRDPAGAAAAGRLPPPMAFAALAERLARRPDGASSMAPPDGQAEQARRFLSRPPAMPEWQWQRLQQLVALNGWNLGRIDLAPLLSANPDQYRTIGRHLADYPRLWAGHLTTDYALVAAALADLLPPALVDHLKLYWTAWLHPETADVENPRQRGYFRHYSWTLGTQNFNFNAIAGAYLGGQLLGAENVLADARYGLENIMLRQYLFYNGANQEIGDTYYQALSNAGIQMIAKYAADPFDRLLARIGSERLTEQLVSMYNPNLRRLTHPMGRGELKYQCAYQDGPYFVLHSLSPAGALIDTDAGYRAQKYGIPLFGSEGPPARMALLAPWADPHWGEVVDGKTLPWQTIARWWHMLPDNAVPAEWHINFLARHYALASRSEDGNPVSHVTAQWRRRDEPVTRMEDLSTLQLSFGGNARVEQAMASWGIVHHRNRLLALKALPPKGFLTFPPNPDYAGGWRAQDEARGKDAFNALNASAMVITFGDVSQREVWIGDRRIDQLSGASSPPNEDPQHKFEQHLRTTGVNSVFAKTGDLIMIKDGVSYLALIPLAINPLARDEQVEVAYEWPVLYVHSFIYRGAEAISQDAWYEAEKRGTAGFVVELGDESEYGSFEGFREHLSRRALSVAWNDEAGHAEIDYRSGEDRLEMGFDPWVMPRWNVFTDTARAPVYRRVNGQWPYLPEGIHRESPWSIQGETGELKKNGYTLRSERGHRTYLLVEPRTGIATAYNPLPDPIFWRLELPTGEAVDADGRLGLLRLQYEPASRTLTVDHRYKPEQEARADVADALLLHGFAAAPRVVFNGEPLRRPARVTIDGRQAWALPLRPRFAARATAERRRLATERWRQADALADQPRFFHDWSVIGPFPNGGYAGQFFQLRDFGPEADGFRPEATYVGLKIGADGNEEAEVGWRDLLAAGEPAWSTQPVELRGVFAPDLGVMAYAAATIVSDRPRRVQLLAGGDERLAVWVNGQRVLFNRGYRLAIRDQDRLLVDLQAGENPVLVKLSHGYEAWRLYFRLADEWGLPLGEAVVLRRPTLAR